MMVFDSPVTTPSVLGRAETGGDVTARGELKTQSAKVTLACGDGARALLDDPHFRSAWSALAQACPWSTPWQSLDHAEIWFSVYREAFDPLLVFQHDPAGDLVGLLVLAENRQTGDIVHVGAHQAEYQVWLATEPNADLFIQRAFGALAARYPDRRLKFQYLPSNTPLAWCRRWGWSAPRVILRRHSRPSLALGPNSRVEESLRKKSNKSRLNRLRRLGPVALVELRTPEERARHFDTIGDFCDFRQGAVNASLPFHDDPRKKELWLRLMDKPGLVNASALMVGDQVAAAHIGPIDGKTVSLGIIAHSPFLADHSPGKLLMLLLARELGKQGFVSFDLTPDGAYKDRFADQSDIVHSLTVYFDPAAYLIEAAKNHLRSAAARLLAPRARRLMKRTRRSARAYLDSRRNRAIPRLQHWAVRQNAAYYATSVGAISCGDGENRLNVNCIADLLLFQSRGDRTKKDFLSCALQRLEAGDTVFTLVEDGRLLHCAWISNLSQPKGLDLPRGFASSSGAYLLWDDFTDPCSTTPALKRSSLDQRLRSAIATHPSTDTIVIKIDDPALLSRYGSAFHRYPA